MLVKKVLCGLQKNVRLIFVATTMFPGWSRTEHLHDHRGNLEIEIYLCVFAIILLNAQIKHLFPLPLIPYWDSNRRSIW